MIVASVAILFIVVIALAGLGFVVVKALGGEEVKLPAGMEITVPAGHEVAGQAPEKGPRHDWVWEFPAGCRVRYSPETPVSSRPEAFRVRVPGGNIPHQPVPVEKRWGGPPKVNTDNTSVAAFTYRYSDYDTTWTFPAGCMQVVPGSSWGTFTIACTIPIALLVGLYMYKNRKGKVVEASVVGRLAVLAATVLGNWVPGSPPGAFFSLSRGPPVSAQCAYGFIA